MYHKLRRKFERPAFTVFLFASLLALHQAHADDWQNIGIYGGGISEIAIDPFDPDHLMAATSGKPYQSHDGGKRWIQVHDPNLEPDPRAGDMTVYGFTTTFDPQTPGRVYLGRYRSDDGGQTWAEVTGTGDYHNILAVHPDDPQVLFARSQFGSQHSFHVTRSGGAPWSTSMESREEQFLYVAVDPNDPNHVFVGSPARGLSTPDKTPGTIYESFDGGTTFSIFLTGIAPGSIDRERLVAPADLLFHNETFWVVLYNGIYRYRAGVLESSLQSRDWMSSIACDPSSNVLYVNEGTTLSNPHIYDTGVHRNDSDLMFEMSLLWKSADDGQSWEPLSTVNGGGNIYASPASPGLLFMDSPYEGVLKSVNGGRVWHTSNIGIEKVTILDIVRHPAAPRRLIAAANNGVHVSHNAGASWKIVGFQGASSVTFADEQGETIIAGGFYGTTIISEDGGKTWRRQRDDVWPYTRTLCADPTRPGLVYGGGITFEGEVEGGLRISHDYAKTWERDPNLTVDCNEITISRTDDGSGDTLLFVCTQEGLYMRVNEAETGVIAHEGRNVENIGCSRSDPLNVLVNRGRFLYWINIQKDGEGLYSLAQSPVPLGFQGIRVTKIHDILIYDEDPGHIVLATDKGIVETFDRGETWSADDSLPDVRLVREEPPAESTGKTANKTYASPPGIIAINGSGAYRKAAVPVAIRDWTEH